MLVALLLALLPQAEPPSVRASPSDEPEAVTREWRLRAAALDPAAHADELGRALGAEPWRVRASALEALARAAEDGDALPGVLLTLAERALSDGHPNVRARAVAVLGAAGAALTPSQAERLAAEPLGSLRHELARALEFTPSPGRAALLARLAFDADERVRAAARNALCGLAAAEAGVGAARRTLVAGADREGLAPLAHLLWQLSLADLDTAWLAEARDELRASPPPARALLEALALARTGRGAAHLLVAGARDEESWEPAPARLLALAGAAHSTELARACLAELAGPDLGPRARRGLLALLVDSLEPRTLAFLEEERTAPERVAEALGELAWRRDGWEEPECMRLAERTRPLAVRRALVTAVADAFTRSPRASSETLLLAFLEDPEASLAARAFEVLCEARARSSAADAALHAVWSRLDGPTRAARLAWFSRELPFPSFRDDWLVLGEDEAQRATACELLAGFEGDAGVASVLVAWSARDLAAFLAAPGRGEEQRVQADLRALLRVDARGGRGVFRAALEATLGRSSEIGKVAAAALGRTPAGRNELAELLRTGALGAEADRRTRIEACLALARPEGAREPSELLPPETRALACARLIEDRAGAAWDLRERMLRALAGAGLATARAELLRLVLDPASEPVERAALASLLAALLPSLPGAEDGDECRAALRAVVRGAYDLEARRVALLALAELGDAAGVGALAFELERGLLAGSAEELGVLRGEFLVALAESGAELDPCEPWLRAPRARAGADLARRFLGQDLPATEFAWRHELVLARLLARDGRAADCLERTQELAQLDGRFLLALGESVAEREPAAAERVLAAAAVALAGERDPDPTLLAWVAAQRLTLALASGDAAHACALAARTLGARRTGALADSRWARLLAPGETPLALEARLRALARGER